MKQMDVNAFRYGNGLHANKLNVLEMSVPFPKEDMTHEKRTKNSLQSIRRIIILNDLHALKLHCSNFNIVEQITNRQTNYIIIMYLFTQFPNVHLHTSHTEKKVLFFCLLRN